MKLKLIKATDQNSTVSVTDDLFVKKINQSLVAQAIRVYLSNQRQGTSKTQARGDVSRTSKKMYKQKGTGGARHGDKTATLFVGGAVAHGPRGVENWSKNLSSKMRILAMKNALTIQAKNMVVTDEILKSTGKTQEAYQFLKKVGLIDKKVLLILPTNLNLVVRSFRNINGLMIVNANRVNVYDLALANAVLLTSESLKILEQRLIDKQTVKEEKSAKTTAEVAKTVKPAVAKKVAKSKPVAKKVAKEEKPVTKETNKVVKKTKSVKKS